MKSNSLREEYINQVEELDIDEVERCLAYTFKAKERLVRALTHCSLSADNNETLEFRGDRIMGFLVSEIIEQQLPDFTVSERQELYQAMTKNEFLREKIAAAWNVEDHLLKDHDNRYNKKIISDTVEAIICAVYDDGGIEECAKFMARHWRDHIFEAIEDGKARLQLADYFNEAGLGRPLFKMSGNGKHCTVKIPPHDGCKKTIQAQGQGKTQRRAKNHAAAVALEKLGLADSPFQKRATP